MAADLTYVLITPARDEEAYVEEAIKAVVGQTVRPARWVIVSDGSTDRTDEIVGRYVARHDWMELIRLRPGGERSFAGKVRAFETGVARMKHLAYDVIGNLDADVSFEADYMEYLLSRFAENPRLGVAGTNQRQQSWEERPRYDYRFTSADEVPGPCQLFRRQCFEAIGGYKPSRHGGVDLLATLEARMNGWETRAYSDRLLIHHRQQGTVGAHPFLVEFQNGCKDYMFGGHPLWEICRAGYQLTRKPHIIGGCLILGGYLAALVTRQEKVFGRDIIRFRRREQMKRLRWLARRALREDRGWGPGVPDEDLRAEVVGRERREA